MKSIINFLIFSLVSITIFKGNCQTILQKDELPSEVIQTIEKRVEKRMNPSIAIAIIDESGTQFYNFGKTTRDENGKDVNENTIYEIGSITKVFTALLLAEQVLEGSLRVDEGINNYLPEEAQVSVMGEQEITFEHLSNHSSGLPRMPSNFHPENTSNPFADYTLEQLYECISNYEPTRAVGSAYEYSNLAQGRATRTYFGFNKRN